MDTTRFPDAPTANTPPTRPRDPHAPPAASTGAAIFPIRPHEPTVLSPRDVTGLVDQRGVLELSNPLGGSWPGSRSGARSFEKKSAAVARGWTSLATAARAQAEARNVAALSLQRAAEIGAAARKAVDDAALHHAAVMDQIGILHDTATIRLATRGERLVTAVDQARSDRTRAALDLRELQERTAASCAQHRRTAAEADLQRATYLAEQVRGGRQLAEEQRLDAISADARARLHLEERGLAHDRVRRERAEVGDGLEQARYDTAFARHTRPTPTVSTTPGDVTVEAIVAGLGTAVTRSELLEFIHPALYGDDTCHPLAAVVRYVYLRDTGVGGRTRADAVRAAAQTALSFLAKPREQWPSDLQENYRHRVAALEAELAAKAKREERDRIDRENLISLGTQPFATPLY